MKLTLAHMRLDAERVIPVIEAMQESSTQHRDPPSERNKQMAIAVLRGAKLADFEVSPERARQITYRLYKRADEILRLGSDDVNQMLSMRLRNCILNEFGTWRAGELRSTTVTERMFWKAADLEDHVLLRWPNFGRKCLTELREVAKRLTLNALNKIAPGQDK